MGVVGVVGDEGAGFVLWERKRVVSKGKTGRGRGKLPSEGVRSLPLGTQVEGLLRRIWKMCWDARAAKDLRALWRPRVGLGDFGDVVLVFRPGWKETLSPCRAAIVLLSTWSWFMESCWLFGLAAALWKRSSSSL